MYTYVCAVQSRGVESEGTTSSPRNLIALWSFSINKTPKTTDLFKI